MFRRADRCWEGFLRVISQRTGTEIQANVQFPELLERI